MRACSGIVRQQSWQRKPWIFLALCSHCFVLALAIPNPVALASSGVVGVLAGVILVLLLILIWQHFDRVLMALTGDDRIHFTVADVVWFVGCRCCGVCSGEFTRQLTSFPCCPGSIFGTNLVRAIGRKVGLVTNHVEVMSLVVGDLPFDRHGDFYLAVEVSRNPPLVTSLANEANPKLVHFPEILTLKIRDSAIEPRIRFVVKELNVFGSEELCELHISNALMLDIVREEDPGERMKRFQMRIIDESIERATPPWIYMQVSGPTEDRELHQLGGYKEEVVRTLDPGEVNGLYRTRKVRDFKGHYTLLDNTGNEVEEPDEAELEVIENLHNDIRRCFRCVNFVALWVLLCYAMFRSYVWSCIRQYTWLTMASLNNATFPVSAAELGELVEDCKHRVVGTGIAPGHPCRPNFPQIIEVCENCPMRRPTAFTGLVYRWSGIHLKHGVPCFTGVCAMRAGKVEVFDTVVAFCAVLIPLTSILVRQAADHWIRWKRNSQQQARVAQAKAIRRFAAA